MILNEIKKINIIKSKKGKSQINNYKQNEDVQSKANKFQNTKPQSQKERRYNVYNTNKNLFINDEPVTNKVHHAYLYFLNNPTSNREQQKRVFVSPPKDKHKTSCSSPKYLFEKGTMMDDLHPKMKTFSKLHSPNVSGCFSESRNKNDNNEDYPQIDKGILKTNVISHRNVLQSHKMFYNNNFITGETNYNTYINNVTNLFESGNSPKTNLNYSHNIGEMNGNSRLSHHSKTNSFTFLMKNKNRSGPSFRSKKQKRLNYYNDNEDQSKKVISSKLSVNSKIYKNSSKIISKDGADINIKNGENY